MTTWWKRASRAALAALSLCLAALPASAEAPATLRQVVVSPVKGDVEVHISASRAITPQTQVITGPDRLVIDFPNTLPGPQLHSQAIDRGKIDRGNIKGVRVGLFTAKPVPVTRVVVDLEGPAPYQIVPAGDSVTVRLNVPGSQPPDAPLAHLAATAPAPTHLPPVPVHASARRPRSVPPTTFSVVRVPVNSAYPPTNEVAKAGPVAPNRPDPRPILAAPYPHAGAPSAHPAPVAPPSFATATPAPVANVPFPPRINVDFHDGKLKIVADHATLAAVLNEVHRRTGAQITIPAGGGLEQVFVTLGPAPPREVLAALLDGSHFNFIMVGSDSDPSQLRSVLLTPRTAGPADNPAPAPYSPPLAAQAPEYSPPNVPTAPEVSNNPPLPADFSTNDGSDTATNPDTGEPDPGAAPPPDAAGPRHPHGHHAGQEPQPEQPQEPPADQPPDQSGDQPQ